MQVLESIFYKERRIYTMKTKNKVLLSISVIPYIVLTIYCIVTAFSGVSPGFFPNHTISFSNGYSFIYLITFCKYWYIFAITTIIQAFALYNDRHNRNSDDYQYLICGILTYIVVNLLMLF